jgi:Rv2525c-like, glycoside hydrolase-like domain
MSRCVRLACATGLLLLLSPFAAFAEDPMPPKGYHPDCELQAGLSIADFSFPVDALLDENQKNGLEVLRDKFMITAILRYYDHEQESQKWKTLTVAEADAIIAAKLSIGVVFQHYNTDPVKFMEPNVGRTDADRALLLADRIGQPYESAIYFGIDGPERHLDGLKQVFTWSNGKPITDAAKARVIERERKSITDAKKEAVKNAMLEQNKSQAKIAAYTTEYLARADVREDIEKRAQKKSGNALEQYDKFLKFGPAALGTSNIGGVTPEAMVPVIARYFAQIRERFNDYRNLKGHGFKIGLYCTPLICVRGEKWADYIWLSPEGRFDKEYTEILGRSDRWHLQQYPESKPCKNWVDTSKRASEISFDFNRPNPRKKDDLGLWNSRRQ